MVVWRCDHPGGGSRCFHGAPSWLRQHRWPPLSPLRRPRPTRRSTSSPTATRRPASRGPRRPASCPPTRRRRCTTGSRRCSATSPTTCSGRAPTAPGTTSRPRCWPRTTRRSCTSQTVSGTSPSAGAVSARIKRDRYGVPHIYSDTDAGAIFGAGYAVATDQSLLLRPGALQRLRRPDRHAGRAGDQPGPRALRLQAEREGRRARSTALQTKNIEAAGRAGQAAAQRHRHLPRGHQRADGRWRSRRHAEVHAHRHLRAERDQGAVPGRGRRRGGRQRAVPRRPAHQARRQGRATRRSRTCARATTPRRPYTTAKAAPNQTDVSVSKPAGMVRLKNGSFKNSFVKLPRCQGVGRRRERRQHRQAPARVEHPDRLGRRSRRPASRCSSAARRSASTTPA